MDNKSLGSVFSLTDEKIKSGIELLQKNQMKTQRAKDICNSLAINLLTAITASQEMSKVKSKNVISSQTLWAVTTKGKPFFLANFSKILA